MFEFCDKNIRTHGCESKPILPYVYGDALSYQEQLDRLSLTIQKISENMQMIQCALCCTSNKTEETNKDFEQLRENIEQQIEEINASLSELSSVFVVNYSMNPDTETITCDKTAAEIYEAYVSGKKIEGYVEDCQLLLSGVYLVNDGEYIDIVFNTIQLERSVSISQRSGEPNDEIHFHVVPLAQAEDMNEVRDCIVTYTLNAGAISCEDRELSLLFTMALEKDGYRGTPYAVICHGNGAAHDLLVDVDVFALQSVTKENEIDPDTGDTLQSTYTIVFSSVIPTSGGVKMRFITQTVVVASEFFDKDTMTSQSATYEEKTITIQA